MNIRQISAALAAITLAVIPVTSQIIGRIALPFTPVVNTPFSAEIVEERRSTTKAGKQTATEIGGSIYRDSQGRLRTETVYGKGPHRFSSIAISDPVQHLEIEWTSAQEIARSMNMQVCSPSNPGKSSIETTKQAPALETHITGSMKSIRENLGKKDIDGLTVVGNRVTLTEDRAGQEGFTMTETWYSPDLETDLLTIEKWSGSAGSGTHTKKLVNIKRSEPSADLFQVPQGYQIHKR
jgi:hypothetical protein